MQTFMSIVVLAAIVAASADARGHTDEPLPTAKVRSACHYNDSRYRHSLFVDKALTDRIDLDEFTALYHEARASWTKDELLSVNIRLCNDPFFENMAFECYDADWTPTVPDDYTLHEVPLIALVGYNGKYRYPANGLWKKPTDPSEDATRPQSFGTVIGKRMFTADSWLKHDMLTTLLSMYETENEVVLKIWTGS